MKQKNLIISCLLILFLFQFFKLPFSAYNLLIWDTRERMTQSYGYCERESWGFYDYVIKKFKLEDKTINIINHEGHVTLEYLFNIDRSINEQTNYYLILNYESSNNESIFDNYKKLRDYKILYRFNNCYLLSNA